MDKQGLSMNWLYVFIGGGLGSVLRYAIGLTTPMFIKTSFPMATFISNTLACLLLAIIVYSVQKEPKADWLNHLLIIGFCGGFSTFSTFSNENVQLIQQGNWQMSMLNILISLTVGMGIIYAVATAKTN
jgi:CrcB protein